VVVCGWFRGSPNALNCLSDGGVEEKWKQALSHINKGFRVVLVFVENFLFEPS